MFMLRGHIFAFIWKQIAKISENQFILMHFPNRIQSRPTRVLLTKILSTILPHLECPCYYPVSWVNFKEFALDTNRQNSCL